MKTRNYEKLKGLVSAMSDFNKRGIVLRVDSDVSIQGKIAWSYSSLPSMKQQIVPTMIKCGLEFVTVQEQVGDELFLAVDLVHIKTGEFLSHEQSLGKVVHGSLQDEFKRQSIISYKIRNAMLGLLNIPTNAKGYDYSMDWGSESDENTPKTAPTPVTNSVSDAELKSISSNFTNWVKTDTQKNG